MDAISQVIHECETYAAIKQAKWKNSCILPEDLKNFYLMTDGFQMTWSVKTDDTPMPLGSMVINSVSKLCRLGGSSMYTLPNAPTLADLEDDTNEEGNGGRPEKPHFDSRSLIFELDPCSGNGKVCLVYKHAKSETWWDSSYDWSVGMEGYRVFRKDRQGRRGGGIALYVNDQLECMELHLGMDKEPTKSLWVRIKGRAGAGDIIAGVCYRPPDQGD
ncbi:tubulin polyglutamylase complex subunit 2 [Grus japonensis]|uniref:Tubulin polyglutamylase complex subunit 2 n=1 Tax=Grus japonensis TaxID=30415 RepID=A0ABC9YA98_GRUJA